MAALPDGEYVLTEHVASPLPARLQTHRRGWMRAPSWPKDTHFIIKAGKWECDRHYGYTRSTALSDRQRGRVFQAVRRYLQLWAPALPSHIVKYGAESALDFLFVKNVSKGFQFGIGGAFKLGNPSNPSYDYIIDGRLTFYF